MKVGVLGSGVVGQALSKAFLAEHYDVMLGTRNPAKEELDPFKKENPGVAVGTSAETAVFGELLILCTNGNVVQEVIRLAGVRHFSGKIVIDTTNPIAAQPPVHGVLHFFTSLQESLMERIQLMLPEAKLVKAFNSVGNRMMYRPPYKEKPSMFICGNDDEARKTVSAILDAFGWETEDMGKAEAARAIEPLCMLWCIPGLLYNQWSHAFKLLKT